MTGKRYRRKSDGTTWRHTWTYHAVQYPIELDNGRRKMNVTRTELRDDFEEVDRCDASTNTDRAEQPCADSA